MQAIVMVHFTNTLLSSHTSIAGSALLQAQIRPVLNCNLGRPFFDDTSDRELAVACLLYRRSL